jgi:hypothetical protein
MTKNPADNFLIMMSGITVRWIREINNAVKDE